MYLTAYDGVYVTECHQALNSDVLQLTQSTSDWQPKHNAWKQLFMRPAEFWVRWPLSLMINASFLAWINSLHQHPWTSICELVELWRAALVLSLISALGVIIIVVNNAATVADLITACQCGRTAGSFVFHVDHYVLWAICTKRKATLDQYVNKDDRLVPEKRLQCLATLMHSKHASILYLTSMKCVGCFYITYMQMYFNMCTLIRTLSCWLCLRGPGYFPHGHLSV